MGRSDIPSSLRSLQRTFLPGVKVEEGPFDLPQSELDKLRKVLRLGSGDEIAVLPNDATVWRCTLQGRQAVPIAVERLETERRRRILLAQALPKPDRLDSVVRQCTEIGVGGFCIFPSDRSVARWDSKKVEDRLRRLRAIAQESAEQSYRCQLPAIDWLSSLEAVLERYPDAQVLSEAEDCAATLAIPPPGTLVIGPEGGWSPRERELIGSRGITLGPLVLRVDTAAAVAATLALLGP